MASIPAGPISLIEMIAHPGLKFLELGVWEGGSTRFLASIIADLKGELHCVDTFEGPPNDPESVGEFAGTDPERKEIIKAAFLANVVNYIAIERVSKTDDVLLLEQKVKPVITLHEGLTEKVVADFPDEYFDIVYIDADHRYHAVLSDIKLYLPKVKIGGIIAGHDFNERYNATEHDNEWNLETRGNMSHFGVSKAVKEIFGDNFRLTNTGDADTSRVWYSIKTQ